MHDFAKGTELKAFFSTFIDVYGDEIYWHFYKILTLLLNSYR